MTKEWPYISISDIANIILGGTPDRNNKDYWNGDIPWATAKDVTRVVGRHIYNTTESITRLGLGKSAAKLLPKGTVIITARGTVGAIAQLGTEMSFNQTCYGLLAKQGIDQDYLFYAIKGSLSEVRSLSYGTVFDTVTMASFDQWKIPLLPLPEQRAIAHILSTLDDKIELNLRMNETLEAMARAIFKSWFVNFDPVIDNALKAGNPIPDELEEKAARRREIIARAQAEGRPAGLPEHLARLFPDEFEESELGWIPKGWRTKTIGEEFNLTMGQSPPGYTYNEIGDGLPFYQGRADFGFRFANRRVFCTAPSRFAEKGDTLVSVRAPVGDVNMANERCCIGRGVAAVRHGSGSSNYTYYFMKSLKHVFARFEAEGTVFGSITKKDFENIRCLAPPVEVVATFTRLVFPIDRQIETYEKQSCTLAALRDALLPKLISGEIRVRDTEKFLEGTL